MAVSSYTITGSKSTSQVELPSSVFAAEVSNHDLLKEAYLAYLANGRDNLAKTLTRSNVRGGGAKPWQQKGTGRARAGSNRSPIWRGGGVVFGPDTNRNYSRKLNAKAKQKALAQSLTLAKAKNFIVLEAFTVKDGKTKSALKLLSKIGAQAKTLIVLDDKPKEIVRATNNLPEIKLTTAKGLNVFDVLNADTIIVTKSAIEAVKLRIEGKK